MCNPFDLTRVNGSVELALPPCTIICNDLIQVSLADNCEAVIGPDEILEGFICPGTYTMDVRDVNNVLLLSATCTQTIVVQPIGSAGFYVKFPDDVVTNNCGTTFPEPVVEALGCALVVFSYTDVIFTVIPDACFRIDRTWTVIDWCTFDPNLPFVQIPNPRPNVIPNHPLNLIGPTMAAASAASPWMPTVSALVPGGPSVNFSIFWSPASNGYQYMQTIKVIDTAPLVIDQSFGPDDVYDITSNDPDLWSGSGWLDPVSGAADLEDAAASLQIGMSDDCFNFNFNVNVRYLLFLDLDQNGTLETVVNSQNLPGFNNIHFNNAFNTNYIGGIPRPFDNRSVAAADKYGFALQVDPAGSGFLANVKWNTQNAPGTYIDPQLPHGTHKIKWFVEDACGNESVYEKAFTVNDSIVLELEPCDNISTTFMPTSTGQNCCATVMVHNQLPDYFSAVQISVLSGASLSLGDVTPGSGWKVGGFSNGTSVTLKPAIGGTIPTGNLDCATICLSKLTAADPYIEEFDRADAADGSDRLTGQFFAARCAARRPVLLPDYLSQPTGRYQPGLAVHRFHGA